MEIITAICGAVCNLWKICTEIIILCWFILNSKCELQSWIEKNISGWDNESLHQKDMFEMKICPSSGYFVVYGSRGRSQYRNTIFHLWLYANIFYLRSIFLVWLLYFSLLSIHNNGWLTAIIYYFVQFDRIHSGFHTFIQIFTFRKSY